MRRDDKPAGPMRLLAATLALALTAPAAHAQFGAAAAAGAAGGAAGAAGAGGFGGGIGASGGNAAAMGAFGTGNAGFSFPAGNGAAGSGYSGAMTGYPGTLGTGGLAPAQAYTSGLGSYNPNLVNPASNTGFGFNPFYNGYNPNLNNIAGPNAFYSGAQSPGSVQAQFANNPLTNNLFGTNFAGPFNINNSLFNNPRVGNLAGNNFPGYNTLQTPSYNPVTSNPIGNNVLGFNPALNGFNYPYATSYVNGLPGAGGLGSPFGLGYGMYYPGGLLGNGQLTLPPRLNGTETGSVSPFDNSLLGPAPFGASRSFAGGYYPNYAQSNPLFANQGGYSTSGFATNAVTYNPFLSFSNYSYGLPRTAYGYQYYPNMYNPYAASMTQYWQNSLYANRFNYRNGTLMTPYAAASFYGPIAELIAMANYKTNNGGLIEPRFRARLRDTNRVPFRMPDRARQAGIDPLPREQVLDEDGNVRWPESAPHADSAMVEAKVQAAKAVKQAAQEQAESGRAKVGDVVDARNKVDRYAQQAMAQARTDGQDGDARELARFFAGLDRALVNMTQMPASMAAVTHIKPEAAPRTAGEILSDKVREDGGPAQPAATAPAPETRPATTPTQDTKPAAAPRTAGEVLKNSQPKKD